MSLQFNIPHRVRLESMTVEVREYEIDHEEEYLVKKPQLRISTALDFNAAAKNPVAVWQLPASNEWIPQRQIGVMTPDTPVRIRIPKGFHRTLGCVIEPKPQRTAPQWSPIAIASTLRVAHESIHQISRLILREMEENRAQKADMIEGLSKLLTLYVGRQLKLNEGHTQFSNGNASHTLVGWRIRKIENAIQCAAMGAELDLDELASQCRMSRQYLLTEFQRACGHSLSDRLWSARAEQAKRLIEQGHSFVEIADQLHYSGASHFTVRFSRHTGLTPSNYRQQVRMRH